MTQNNELEDESLTISNEDVSEDIPDEPLDYDSALILIAAGNYKLRVVKAEYAVSKPQPGKKRKHMLRLDCQIVNAQVSKHEVHVGNHVVDNLVFTQGTARRIAQFSKEAGVDAPTVASRATLEDFATAIIGVEVSANVGHEVWNGDKRARVTAYGSAPAPKK